MFWPGNARLVISISMQFEAGAQGEGAEGPFPPLDPRYPDTITPTWYAYGMREGVPRLLDLWDRFRIKVDVPHGRPSRRSRASACARGCCARPRGRRTRPRLEPTVCNDGAAGARVLSGQHCFDRARDWHTSGRVQRFLDAANTAYPADPAGAWLHLSHRRSVARRAVDCSGQQQAFRSRTVHAAQ
jgi:hypothetical protein